MEENELFGEAHEQEENGLFGRMHQAEQLNLCGVSKSFVCTYCGINPLVDTCQQPKKCYSARKILAN
jgi:hypothetical protein